MTLATTQIASARTRAIQLGEMSAIQASLPAPRFEFVGDLADLEKDELVAARRDGNCADGCSNCACGPCNCEGCNGCNGNCSSCQCVG